MSAFTAPILIHHDMQDAQLQPHGLVLVGEFKPQVQVSAVWTAATSLQNHR